MGYGSRVAGRTLVREASDRVSGLIRIEEFDFKLRFSDRTLAREARDRVSGFEFRLLEFGSTSV